MNLKSGKSAAPSSELVFHRVSEFLPFAPHNYFVLVCDVYYTKLTVNRGPEKHFLTLWEAHTFVSPLIRSTVTQFRAYRFYISPVDTAADFCMNQGAFMIEKEEMGWTFNPAHSCNNVRGMVFPFSCA